MGEQRCPVCDNRLEKAWEPFLVFKCHYCVAVWDEWELVMARDYPQEFKVWIDFDTYQTSDQEEGGA